MIICIQASFHYARDRFVYRIFRFISISSSWSVPWVDHLQDDYGDEDHDDDDDDNDDDNDDHKKNISHDLHPIVSFNILAEIVWTFPMWHFETYFCHHVDQMICFQSPLIFLILFYKTYDLDNPEYMAFHTEWFECIVLQCAEFYHVLECKSPLSSGRWCKTQPLWIWFAYCVGCYAPIKLPIT